MVKKENILKKNKPETKEQKLSRIKSEVSKGTYKVESKEVAKSIIKKTKENSKK